jgi:predicted Zn-dependent peptidase
MYEELMQLAFVTSPYRWPTVGYAGDLASMSLADARAFFDRHYVASNAVGCVVGDVDAAALRPLLEKTFGVLPTAPRPAAPFFSEAPVRSQRRGVVTFDAQPRLLIGFRKPRPPSREDAVFDVLNKLLSEGNTSRLQQRLVFRDRLAQGVGVFTGPGNRLDNLFVIAVTPLAGAKLEAIEAAVFEELARLGAEPVQQAELERVRRRISTDLYRTLQSNGGAAGALSRAQALYDDWRYPLELPKVIDSIEAAEVQAVARQAFVKENSVIVTLVKP